MRLARTLLGMFRRRSSPTDTVAAAQRRLAQLTAEFAASRRDPLEAVEPPDGTTVRHRNEAEERPEQRPAAFVPPGGRGRPDERRGRHAAAAERPSSARRLSTDHVAVTVAAALVLVSVGGWMWWRARPETVPVADSSPSHASTLPSSGVSNAPPASRSVPADSASAHLAARSSGDRGSAGRAATGTANSSTRVVVDVEGRIRRPGIVDLPAGSRVIDAIRAAGGTRPDARLRTVNLARLLVDGEQLLVGLPGANDPSVPTSSEPGQTSTGGIGSGVARVDLNTATQEQLEALPQIGPVTAQAILAWRRQHRRFSSVDELLEVRGIGDATLAQLRPFVYV
jgi:competence protein ComEA